MANDNDVKVKIPEVAVRPKELATILRLAFEMRCPVLVAGRQGSGKDAIIDQTARSISYDHLKGHPTVEDPTDPKGIPWPDAATGEARYVVAGTLAKVLHATRPTVWNLVDFGQATPAVQAPYMQWLWGRECAGHKLPDCVSIVATTNYRTERAGVQGILETVKGRVLIVHLRSHLDDWCEYAVEHNFHPCTVAFARFRPDLLNTGETTNDMENHPTERNWERVSDWTWRKLPVELELPVYSGCVGRGGGSEYLAFLQVFRDVPNPDAILKDPQHGPVPEQPNSLYALCSALAYRCTTKTFPAIVSYAERLHEHTTRRSEFAVMLIRDAYMRDKTVANTKTFEHLRTTALGKMILNKSE